MASYSCRVKGETNCGIIGSELEEGMGRVVGIQQAIVESNDVCHVQKYLIEAESFDFPTPSERFEKFVEGFGGIPKPGQILTEDNNDIRYQASRFIYELKFLETSPPGFVIASDNYLFLWTLEIEVEGVKYGGVSTCCTAYTQGVSQHRLNTGPWNACGEAHQRECFQGRVFLLKD